MSPDTVSVTLRIPPTEVRGVGSYSNTGAERTYTATSLRADAYMLGNELRISVWFSGSTRAFTSNDPAIRVVKATAVRMARRAWDVNT